MKIRTDFVTNSSSTCYCMVGVQASELDPVFNGESDDNETMDWDALMAYVGDLRSKGLDVACYVESREGIIGLEIEKMKGEETLNGFKARIADLIEKAYPGKRFKVSQIKVEASEYDQNI